MGERRKRRSMWDMEEETKHFSDMSKHNSSMGKEHRSNHDGGRYRQFSASGTYAAQTSRDHSGQQSWESTEENSVASMNGRFSKSRQNGPERKELGGGNRYYQEMSPGLDGMEPHKYNHSLENDRSHALSHRNMGRARSRSRSRSMPRGRSRSRSLSRGRGRERGRGRSRSRSRSPSDSAVRVQTRNRSPTGDYRHQSHAWNDRSAPNKSTQICRDFASGGCRRGSQCRFFHPKSTSGDRDHISNSSYSRGDDVSDPYHGQNEQFQNKSRSAVPCKDFVKGNCRWGDACRFSHHFASDESFGKGARYKSFDNDIELEPCKNGKPVCKYFAAGNCDRDNCRFSHEGPKPKGQEDRRGYGREVGTSEAIRNENTANEQEDLILHGLQLQTQDVNSDILGQNKLLEDQSFPMTAAWQQNVPPVPRIQQQNHGLVENNLVSSSLRSEVLDEAKDFRNTTNPFFFSGQNLNHQSSENVFPVQSSVLSETDGGKNMLGPNPLNGFGSDLSGSETHLAVRLSLQNLHKAVQMTGMLETEVPQFFPTLLASQDSAQPTKSPVCDEQENHTERKNGGESDNLKVELSGSPKLKQEKVLGNAELNEGNRGDGDESKGFQNNKPSENVDGHGKVEESTTNKDDKGIRIFKNSLVEFVKDLLKPIWKEGKMSREAHKTIVKKVVDKVTSTIQADQIPKTQEKIEQYLSYSKPKIAKLVQAYVGRCSKKDS
ncbi:hypothetical protein ABFS83_14G307000 [Erythranthe nasuta]